MSGSLPENKPNPTTFQGLPGPLPGNGLCALEKYFDGIRLIAFAIKWFRNPKAEENAREQGIRGTGKR